MSLLMSLLMSPIEATPCPPRPSTSYPHVTGRLIAIIVWAAAANGGRVRALLGCACAGASTLDWLMSPRCTREGSACAGASTLDWLMSPRCTREGKHWTCCWAGPSLRTLARRLLALAHPPAIRLLPPPTPPCSVDRHWPRRRSRRGRRQEHQARRPGRTPCVALGRGSQGGQGVPRGGALARRRR